MSRFKGTDKNPDLGVFLRFPMMDSICLNLWPDEGTFIGSRTRIVVHESGNILNTM